MVRVMNGGARIPRPHGPTVNKRPILVQTRSFRRVPTSREGRPPRPHAINFARGGGGGDLGHCFGRAWAHFGGLPGLPRCSVLALGGVPFWAARSSNRSRRKKKSLKPEQLDKFGQQRRSRGRQKSHMYQGFLADRTVTIFSKDAFDHELLYFLTGGHFGLEPGPEASPLLQMGDCY